MQCLTRKIRCRRLQQLQGLQSLHGGSRSGINKKNRGKVDITSGKLKTQKLKNKNSVNLGF